jgi:predicted PurR-regulated permease PerM
VAKDNVSIIGNGVGEGIRSVLDRSIALVGYVSVAVVNSMIVVFFVFFILLEKEVINRFFYSVLPHETALYIRRRQDLVLEVIRNWIKGQTALALIM